MSRWSIALIRTVLGLYPFRNGQGRLIDRTPLGRLRFAERELTVRTTDGFELTIAPNDHIGRHLALTGKFDRTNAEVLVALGRRDDRIFDIGANVGYVSAVLLARLADCQVASVDPQPGVFELLERNLKRVGGARATTIRAAVSDRSGDSTLLIHPTNRGASRLAASDGESEGHHWAGETRASVALITGEELFRRSGFDRLDLVKIDVEGHELAVLSSLAPVIERCRPRAILFEHHPPLDDSSLPIRRLFTSLGYELRGIVKSLNGWRLVPLAELARRKPHDYVAMPSPSA